MPWPTYPGSHLEELEARIESRYKAVSNRLVEYYFKENPAIVRWLAKKIAQQKRFNVRDFASAQI